MLFNTIQYILFLPTVILLFFLIPARFRWILLLVASYTFYLSLSIEYFGLLVFNTVVNFYAGRQIEKTSDPKRKKSFLILGIASSLAVLFFFKYFGFFNETVNSIIEKIGGEATLPSLILILPVGISFYTFQALSYTLDVYWGIIKPEKHFGKFALFVAFFPQLVAGPIERAANLIPQFSSNDYSLNYANFLEGISRILLGLFKKVVIADTLSIYVDSIYGSPFSVGFTLYFATAMFAFQVYCDFSGYSDIAIGSAKIMGYNLMENFKLPYFSTSLSDFWKRWHISLYHWFTVYLYTPLAYKKRDLRMNGIIYALMITFLLSGLWHGAAWTFVIWGGLNGLGLVFEMVAKKPLNKFYGWMPGIVASAIGLFFTFNFIVFTDVFFRADSFSTAIIILNNTFSSGQFWNLKIQDTGVFASMLFTLFVLIILEITIYRRKTIAVMADNNETGTLLALNVVIAILIIIFGNSDGSQFIYFQF